MLEVATIRALSLPLTDAYNFFKSKSSKFAKIRGFDVEEVYLKASQVENVKTIWQVDKSVNLKEFYYPSRLKLNSNTLSDLNSLSDLPENGKIVIQGTAGQGKSILARFLTGKALREGVIIPLFIELRKITERASLETLIHNAILNIGITIDKQDIYLVFESNKFTLILDAFDEIPELCVKDTLNYIENLSSLYHSQQLIITSRPNSEIQKVNCFEVYNLAILEASDFKAMLSKLFDEQGSVEIILKSIHDSSSRIEQLLTTPLLLTLLAITYKSYNKIPTQLHEFYENLFHLLVNRHDATKPGYNREYKSGLNEKELEELFKAFCFYATLKGQTSLTKSEVFEVFKKAKDISGLPDVNDLDFITDCKNNTCLILEEGFQYHFLHKSIMEFHAASYISSSPQKLKEKFYYMVRGGQHQFWVELNFLKVLDEYNYNSLFLIPEYESQFEKLGVGSGDVSTLTLQNLLNTSTFEISSKVTSGRKVSTFTFGDTQIPSVFQYLVFNKVANKIIKHLRDFETSELIKDQNYPMLDMIEKIGMTEELLAVAEAGLKEDFKVYNKAKDYLKSKELLINAIDFE